MLIFISKRSGASEGKAHVSGRIASPRRLGWADSAELPCLRPRKAETIKNRQNRFLQVTYYQSDPRQFGGFSSPFFTYSEVFENCKFFSKFFS